MRTVYSNTHWPSVGLECSFECRDITSTRTPFVTASDSGPTSTSRSGMVVGHLSKLVASWTQLDCLNTVDSLAIDGETQQGPHPVPAVVAACPGVHVNQSQRLIPHSFK